MSTESYCSNGYCNGFTEFPDFIKFIVSTPVRTLKSNKYIFNKILKILELNISKLSSMFSKQPESYKFYCTAMASLKSKILSNLLLILQKALLKMLNIQSS